MRESALKLVNYLRENKLHIASAESCTGGIIAAAITDVPGSSEVFDCGVVSYGENIKHSVLGVSENVLKKNGAVSFACASMMAEGVASLAKAEIGVSTTGFAGPGGGTEADPVGTVFIGVYSRLKGHSVFAKSFRYVFEGDREAVRNSAAEQAIAEICKLLNI